MKISVLLLFASIVAGCANAPVAQGPLAPRFPGNNRSPAASLPEGYQVKSQDHWILGVWNSEDGSSFLGSCKIRKTATGFEAGSSRDADGYVVMRALRGDEDLALAERLVELAAKGFEDGYSPYLADCSGKKRNAGKCRGPVGLVSFLEYEGAQEMPMADGSSIRTDVYNDRTVAVHRSGNLWYSSAHSGQVAEITRCLCARYSREEERGVFGTPENVKCPGDAALSTGRAPRRLTREI